MYKKILVPVDGSATSLRGLEEAIRLAKPLDATLRIVHVVNEFLMDQGYLPSSHYDSVIASLREVGQKVLLGAGEVARRSGVPFESALLETIGGRTPELIIADAKEWSAELIVMGTHGRRGARRIALGSDAELVLRSSPVPVLMVRGAPPP